VTPSTSSTYFITVQDGCGSTLSDTISYVITSPPLLTSVNNVPEICPGDSAYISVSAVGGYGNYHYYWALNGDTTNGIWVNPIGTSTYLVEVSDDCQTFSIPTLAQVTVVKPDANFSVSSLNLIEGLPISFQNLTTNGYVYDWYFSDGGYSDLVHPTHTFNPAGDYLITLVATDAKGCVDSITKPIHIFEEFYIYIPNTFFPDEDRINEYFAASFIGVKSAEIYIYNRWGELVFESLDKNFRWDGKYKGEKVQQGTYSWLLKYKRNGTETEILTGHINVLR
jgi:gliding motility-associated-like protein